MIYFICGDDLFRVKEYVGAVKEAAAKSGVAVTSFDAATMTADGYHEALQTGSLFSKKRAVFVRNLLAQGTNEMKEVVLRTLPLIPDEVTLVLGEDGTPDRRTKLFHELEKRAKIIEKPILKDAGIRQWIRERGRKKGLAVSEAAAMVLFQAVGGNLAQADNELEKLSLYAKGRSIEAKDIADLVEPGIESNIFDLLDAIGNRDGRAGLFVEKLLASGAEPPYILSMLAYQVRNLLLVHDLIQRKPNVQPPEVARQLRLHPYVAEKTLAQARIFAASELVALHGRLTEADIAVKTGAVDAPDALILLVGQSVPLRR